MGFLFLFIFGKEHKFLDDDEIKKRRGSHLQSTNPDERIKNMLSQTMPRKTFQNNHLTSYYLYDNTFT